MREAGKRPTVSTIEMLMRGCTLSMRQSKDFETAGIFIYFYFYLFISINSFFCENKITLLKIYGQLQWNYFIQFKVMD